MPVLIFALQVRCQLFFVLQTYERQPACRDRRTCCRPVFLLQNLLHLLRRVNAHTDLNQRPGDDPDHVVEETAAADADRNQVVCLRHGQAVDRPHRLLRLRPHRTETLEIVLADEIGCRLLHFL